MDEKGMKITGWLGGAVIIILIGWGVIYGSSKQEDVQPMAQINAVELAEHLTSEGWIFYGTAWCPHCNDQKEAFGEAMEKIIYIECWDDATNTQTEECNMAGIESYPSWMSPEGEITSGNLSFKQLSGLSDFEPEPKLESVDSEN